jgi:hypothetical protein
MTPDFDYSDIADRVLDEHGQDASFKRRFVGYCENTMEGNADDNDLKRLIENIEIPDSPGK